MEVKKEAWNKFIATMDFESDVNNFKICFKDMSKKHGNAFIIFCKAAWSANDDVMTEEEFMKINCDMSRGFFEKNIKGV